MCNTHDYRLSLCEEWGIFQNLTTYNSTINYKFECNYIISELLWTYGDSMRMTET